MNTKINQSIRNSAYGVLLHDFKILLTFINSGPYKGLWGLPGGGIEFGETPEKALRRELLEETALIAGNVEFLYTASSTGEYTHDDIRYGVHQIGLIYNVLNWVEHPALAPEDEYQWIGQNEIKIDKLNPIANEIISKLNQKGPWRPINRIRGKVIGLAKQDNRLLVCEVIDDKGDLKGWCPLGGGIEFGETAANALKREFLEELGCEIQINGHPIVYENIFEHHGAKGHEVIFAFPITLADPKIYTQNRFRIYEPRGSIHWVEWIDIENFRTGKTVLFPKGILVNIF